MRIGVLIAPGVTAIVMPDNNIVHVVLGIHGLFVTLLEESIITSLNCPTVSIEEQVACEYEFEASLQN